MMAHKKILQLSSLHFLADAAVPLMVWIGLKLAANTTVAFLLVHSVVDILNHAYYQMTNLQDYPLDEAVDSKVSDSQSKARFNDHNDNHTNHRRGRCPGVK
jgi:hypothetical protein